MYEHTTTVLSPLTLNEAGADTKTPGKGLTYSVYTVEVVQTFFFPTFSTFLSTGTPANIANPLGVPAVQNGAPKQVVVLQCVDAVGEIQWQSYFFGETPGDAILRRATNARAISVWEADTPAEARIAICGETYEDRLPLSQDPVIGFPQVTAFPDPTGFIAVFDGNGVLQWTHHFFGVQLTNPLVGQGQPDCAITDVSIRVEGSGANRRDVVTYCGVSTYGNPAGGNLWLDPILPFGSITTDTSAGDTDFGVYQWDGVVGRISRPHDAPYDPQQPLQGLLREFHSIVGGPEQDGLFGIAETADNRFLTVGSSRHLGAMAPAVGFPFATVAPAYGGVPTPSYPYAVGTMLAFDAAPTRLPTPGLLELENGFPVGSFSGAVSHCSDVFVHTRSFDTVNTVFVVGTTADPDLFTAMGAVATTGYDTLSGPTDGFLVVSSDIPAADALLDGDFGGLFLGGPGDDGLTGVNSWSEHSDHAQMCGYSIDSGSLQMQVASVICWGPGPPPTLLRHSVFGGSGTERPAVMGALNATNGTSGIAYQLAPGFQDSAGGGIAVDERARVTIVGASDSGTGYPVVNGRPYRGGQDAVRTELDMLPIGVGRTDGTGSQASGAPASPPPAGFSGGTTPACLVAPSPYGVRIGEPPPLLQRILIDYEGANGPGALPTIWSTRPPVFGDVVVGALQFGLPATTPFVLDLAEIWTLNNPTLYTEVWVGNGLRPWSIPFTVPLPAGPQQFTAQVTCLVLTPFTAAPCGSQQLSWFASPALFFEY